MSHSLGFSSHIGVKNVDFQSSMFFDVAVNTVIYR